MGKFHLLLIVYCLCLFDLKAQKISYTVDLREPHKNTYRVSLELNYKNAPDTVVLKMATWTPGSYLIREFAKHVNVYSASNKKGEKLNSFKKDKNTWVVHNDGQKNIVFNYSVYAHELSVRTTFLNADFGLINGTALYIYPNNALDKNANVQFILPKSWNISTTLPLIDEKENKYNSNNYDQLFDCPVLLGKHKEFAFEAKGVKHRVAINSTTFYDPEMLKEDISKIVEAQTEIFNDNPNEEYLFIVIARKHDGGGLEHKNSTTLIVDRFDLAKESGYRQFLSLVAHEYFHLWNVKRLRPLELGPFDFEHENYTDLLWVMEGFTSYYGAKTLVRIGESEENSFFRRIANSWEREYERPGAKIQSIAESSLDAWIKLYRDDENDYNATVSYYSRGFLMAAMLEMLIIQDSNAEYSLDELMKRLYEKYHKSNSRGFTMEEFIKEINDLCGKDYSEFFKKYIYDTQMPPLDSIMRPFGYEVKFETSSNSEWGFRVKNEDKHYIINRIISGTPAHEAGLNVDDEIIAIDSFAFDMRKLAFFAEYYPDNYSLEFVVIRDDILKKISLMTPEATKNTLEISQIPELNEDEVRFRKKMLFNN
ncbi:MAG: PDZ domain-containing protein [Cytophagales bacterium]